MAEQSEHFSLIRGGRKDHHAAGLSVAASGVAGKGPEPLGKTAAPNFALYPPRAANGLDPRRPGLFAEGVAIFHKHHAELPQAPGRGGLFILDFEQVRRRFGKRWPAIQEKAYQLIEGSLARHLGPRDRYVAIDGDRFYLLMTDVERAMAERRVRLLAGEITERLCGTVPGGVACGVQTTTFDLKRDLVRVSGLADLQQRIDKHKTKVDNAERALFATHAGALEARHAPIINARKRRIAAHALEALHARPEETVPFSTLCPSSVDGVFSAELDRWSIDHAAESIASTGYRGALLVRLHYSTLAAMRHREPLMFACRRLPVTAKRRLLVELTDVPASLPQARARELLGYLHPFVAGVVMNLDPAVLRQAGTGSHGATVRQAIAEHLENTGIVGISVDLSGERRAERTDPLGAPAADLSENQDAEAAIAALAQLARGLDLRSFCRTGDSLALCRAAIASGIDYLQVSHTPHRRATRR